MKVLVTGASGFIGHHLCKKLKSEGHYVVGVDWKEAKYGLEYDEFYLLDLRYLENCDKVTKGVDEAWLLAADMGGMGFIQDEANQGLILYNNTLINFHSLEMCRKNGVKKVLYSSSACVYPNYKQLKVDSPALKESDAYPAEPQDTYGWEKLQMEHLCNAYQKHMDIKIVRFHNIYGPEGTFDGGREKAPAAFCRKVINADVSVEMWGDGKQTRSFCYIDDCLKALELVMDSKITEPINIGRDDMVSMNKLMYVVMKVGNKDLEIEHIDGPEGVRGRNSDNTLFKSNFNWEPEITLEEGIRRTYKWIQSQLQ